MILPFSTLYFSHVLSALLGFARVRAVLARARADGPPRPLLLALAGLLAGLAIVCEYPLAIAAIVVGLYAITRAGGAGLVRRARARTARASPPASRRCSPTSGGRSARRCTRPTSAPSRRPAAAATTCSASTTPASSGSRCRASATRSSLLFSGRGLLTLTPVLVVAIAGVVALHRARPRAPRRARSAAIALAYLVYNAGYWLPIGGGSPGPRFLIPILPFLALGLGPAWRRWPAVTLALTAISATTMVAATMSYPMIGIAGPGRVGAADRRLRPLPAQRARPRRDRARPAVDPAVRAARRASRSALGVSSLGRAHLARRRAPRAGWRSASGRCARSCCRSPAQLPSGGRARRSSRPPSLDRARSPSRVATRDDRAPRPVSAARRAPSAPRRWRSRSSPRSDRVERRAPAACRARASRCTVTLRTPRRRRQATERASGKLRVDAR